MTAYIVIFMKSVQMIRTFTDKYPFVGPLFWIISVQYFIVQLIVASAWSVPFSLTKNTISDLGNTYCGVYGVRYVCSPQHGLMNASLIILGITMIVGATLIYQEFRENLGSFIGFTCMAVAGFGTLLVGLFPENTVNIVHILGAAMPFLIGNIGLLILGTALELPKPLKIYTIASGLVALVALVFFTTHTYLGLGIGGMERLTAYPQTLWLIVFGVYMSKDHLKRSDLDHR